jgi:hypothetical protein
MDKYHNEMYSIVDFDTLKNIYDKVDFIEQNKIKDLFEIEKIINPLESITNCISVSFFAQNVDNKFVNIDIPDHQNKQGDFYKKYTEKFINFIKDYNNSKFYFAYKIRIYLEKQLYSYIDFFLSLSDHIEIYYMKHNSIGASPGMLWRHLAFDDKTLDTVFSSDIDVDFYFRIPHFLHNFSKSNKTFGRLMVDYNDDFIIDKQNKEDSPMNYSVCLGSLLAFRPKKNDFQIKDTIIQYILYRIERTKTMKPSEDFDDKNTDKYNKPIDQHIYGWGGYWTMYGFDEKYLKHTVFPYLVRKGEVISFLCNRLEEIKKIAEDYPNHPSAIDYNFVKLYDNEFL